MAPANKGGGGDDDAASSSSAASSGSDSRRRRVSVLRDGLLVLVSKAKGDEGTEAILSDEEEEAKAEEEEEEEGGLVGNESIPPDESERDGAAFSAAEVWKCPGASAGGTTCSSPGADPRCPHSLYGRSLSPEEARSLVGPDSDGGLVYHALLLPDDYDADPRKVRALSAKDYDAAAGAPKPRRKVPFPVKSSDFFSSLTMIGRPAIEHQAEAGYDDLWDAEVRTSASHLASSARSSRRAEEDEGARWVFRGVLNGWPGLRTLELRGIAVEERGMLGRKIGWKKVWRADHEGAEGVDPSSSWLEEQFGKNHKKVVRAKLRAPEWSAHGWSEGSPGFLFWVTGPTVDDPAAAPTVTYGTDVQGLFKCPEEDDPQCERVTMVCHRYATGGKEETTKDMLTYHSLALLEWDHRRYCTVVEIGWLNGIGGYKGKANWFEDKDAPQAALYAALPPEMVLPWRNTMSEIRCYDVPFPSLPEFKSYVAEYEGRSSRFVDPRYPFSHEVRLTYRSRRNVAAYLLNYIRRDRTYSEMRRNCQTFTADFCGFLAGKKDVQPFHPVNQLQYVNQKHKFLYESGKYK